MSGNQIYLNYIRLAILFSPNELLRYKVVKLEIMGALKMPKYLKKKTNAIFETSAAKRYTSDPLRENL